MTHLHPETLEKLKADAKQPRVRDRCEGCRDMLPGCSTCPTCDFILCKECMSWHKRAIGVSDA